eukprot:Hpha_TRINITY_DN15565_c4_g6::TRINITY_DN15565_c4_g6_i2::g.108012::m.108012
MASAHVSPQSSRPYISPLRARVVQTFTGAAEGSIAVIASGEGLPSERGTLEHRRRHAGHEAVRNTSSSLPVDMRDGGAPRKPTGARRDDALTLVTGDVHTQCDPPRFRKVHGQAEPPHLKSSAGDWFGHRGGYARPDAQQSPHAVQGNWMKGSVLPKKGPGSVSSSRANSESHVSVEQGNVQPVEGCGIPFYQKPVGKRQPQEPVRNHLDSTFGSPAPRSTGRRCAGPTDAAAPWEPPTPSVARSPPPRTPAKELPYGTSKDAAPTPADERRQRVHPTNQSTVANYMSTQQSTRSPGKDCSVEREMVRKARAAPSAAQAFSIQSADGSAADKGLRVRGLAQSSGRAPFGTDKDAGPVACQSGRRRAGVTSAAPPGHSNIAMLGEPAAKKTTGEHGASRLF